MGNTSTQRAVRSARILLVDDNKMGLSARKIVLEELGYTITASTSGVEALTQFGTSEFDLVVTDYKLPRMNGVEFITQIRQQRPEVPVIMLSGFADALGLSEVSTGADIVIQKSNHEVSSLIRSVNRLLTRKPPKKAQARRTCNQRKSG
jgi:CheY-like chemotaxis protein